MRTKEKSIENKYIVIVTYKDHFTYRIGDNQTGSMPFDNEHQKFKLIAFFLRIRKVSITDDSAYEIISGE